MSDHDIKRELKQIEARLNAVEAEEDIILVLQHRILALLQRLPTGMVIDILGDTMATQAGGTSVFQEVPTPAGSTFPAGTTFTWSVDDTADITLTPSADGTQVTAVCVATPTGTSYNLTCQSNFVPPGATTGISATLNVPIVPAVITPTGMTINQLS